MPVSGYYKGSGVKVMSNLKDEYGKADGERAFYAIANAKKLNPAGAKRSPSKTGTKRGGSKRSA